jgi:transcriptional regulator with XRE-family HTH domain
VQRRVPSYSEGMTLHDGGAHLDRRAFGRLLRRWRASRGLTQRALAGAADVSPRHVAFLESGRARPSRAMALGLGVALDLPMGARNELLEAAGFAPAWREGEGSDAIDGAVAEALQRMMRHHEPYPLVVMNRAYDIVLANVGAMRLLAAFAGDGLDVRAPLNVLALLSDPKLLRPWILDWERTAVQTLALARREALRHPEDRLLAERLRAVSAFDPPGDCDAIDLPPAFVLRARKGTLSVAFLTTLTIFNAPSSAAVETLRIESYFPLDAETEAACRALTGVGAS